MWRPDIVKGSYSLLISASHPVQLDCVNCGKTPEF